MRSALSRYDLGSEIASDNMNIRRPTVLLLLLLIFIPVGLSAEETKYVTDRLSLGLFEKEKTSGKRIATLDSGTELEVLNEQRSYAKVRTADGDVGWVKSAYLVSDKPAVVKVSELESMYQEKVFELDACMATETEPPEHTIQRLKTLEKQLADKEKELKNAKIRTKRLVRRVNTPQKSILGDYEYLLSASSLLWYVVGAFLLFATGSLFGVHIINSRLRKRFYGFTLG